MPGSLTVGFVNAALIPVRAISGGKNRLASCLTAEQREALAVAMLDDMLAALELSEAVQLIAVVSSDADLLRHAAERGARAIDEGNARGLNQASTLAAAELASIGVKRLLTIPGDVPLLDAAEIDAMFSANPERYPVVLAPSASVTGTNGLLTSPPQVIPFCFEGESLAAHRVACRSAKVELLLLGLPSFAVDIDTPADVLTVSESSSGATGDLLVRWQQEGLIDRLAQDDVRTG